MTARKAEAGLAAAIGRGFSSSSLWSRCFGCRPITGSSPTLGGVPFFYWYQLAWILIGAAIVLLVFMIDRRLTHAPKTASEDTTGIPGDIL